MNGNTHPANFVVRQAPAVNGPKRNVLLPVFESRDYSVSIYAVNAIHRIYHNSEEAFPVGFGTAGQVAELVREMKALSRGELLEIRGLTNDAIDTMYAWIESYECGCRAFEIKAKDKPTPVPAAKAVPNVVGQRDLFIAAAITGLTQSTGPLCDSDKIAGLAIEIADATVFALSN